MPCRMVVPSAPCWLHDPRSRVDRSDNFGMRLGDLVSPNQHDARDDDFRNHPEMLAGTKCLAARRTQTDYRFAFHKNRTSIAKVITARGLVRDFLYHGRLERLPAVL